MLRLEFLIDDFVLELDVVLELRVVGLAWVGKDDGFDVGLGGFGAGRARARGIPEIC